MKWRSLAFVDLETTGLSPSRDRITEIGLVLVDRNCAQEWTTLLNPCVDINEGSRWFNDGASPLIAAPYFKDIASDLLKRLEGRLFIAHNARFDFGFLQAEFRRAGIEFSAPVLCSAMAAMRVIALAKTGRVVLTGQGKELPDRIPTTPLILCNFKN